MNPTTTLVQLKDCSESLPYRQAMALHMKPSITQVQVQDYLVVVGVPYEKEYLECLWVFGCIPG